MNSLPAQLRRAAGLALCVAALGVSGQAPAVTPTPAKVLPGDDFFAYVNGDWLAKTEIPADRSGWGAGSALAEETNERIHKMIKALAADRKVTGEARKVADFYQAYMDETAMETRGLTPIQPLLDKIGGIHDKAGLVKALGASLRVDVDALNSTNFFTENLFGIWIVQGLNDPSHYTPYLMQGGLGMPDRAYYLTDNPRMAALRTQYVQHIAATLRAIGVPAADADKRAAKLMALEVALAQAHAPREDSEDIQKANNPWTLLDFSTKAPGIDWPAFFRSANLGGQKKFIVWHPGAVTGAAALVESTDLATWKDHLVFHTVNHFANVLPKAFADRWFAFHETALSGTPQQPVRWKRALAASNVALEEPLAHLYVDRYFSAADKARVQKMVANIVTAFGKRIDLIDWMAPATRAQAKAKLHTLYVGVGYPDRWHSYAGLTIKADDAFGNVLRAELFHTATQIAKLRQKVDHTEWCMSPVEVNAVNMPLQNALNFPAAILQPPFFDPKASDAANYGAIGSVIGHEISHSFDDQGAQFDAKGVLRNWWTKQDLEHFQGAAAKLVAQYSAYKPFADLALNGQQTLSENLADLAGLAAALDAYKAAQAGKTPAADGDAQFFAGYAASWRNKQREESERRRILTDGHSPSEYRTATVRNLDAWYAAFNVLPGQTLYLKPEDRVRVW